MGNLHWSVDYSYQTTRRDFREEFTQILNGALFSSPIDLDAGKKTHRYTILPNFWSGYKRDSPDDRERVSEQLRELVTSDASIDVDSRYEFVFAEDNTVKRELKGHFDGFPAQHITR